MKRVIAFGSFDLIHPGHIYFLKEASRLGDELIVVVALDSTILKIKKRKPKYNEKERLAHISELRFVDNAVLGDPNDPFKVIAEQKPDVIALGYDQDSFTEGLDDALLMIGIDPVIVRLKPYKHDTYKSSKLR